MTGWAMFWLLAEVRPGGHYHCTMWDLEDLAQLRKLQAHIRFGTMNTTVKAAVNDIGVLLYNLSVQDDNRSLDDAHVVFEPTEKISVVVYPTHRLPILVPLSPFIMIFTTITRRCGDFTMTLRAAGLSKWGPGGGSEPTPPTLLSGAAELLPNTAVSTRQLMWLVTNH